MQLYFAAGIYCLHGKLTAVWNFTSVKLTEVKFGPKWVSLRTKLPEDHFMGLGLEGLNLHKFISSSSLVTLLNSSRPLHCWKLYWNRNPLKFLFSQFFVVPSWNLLRHHKEVWKQKFKSISISTQLSTMQGTGRIKESNEAWRTIEIVQV